MTIVMLFTQNHSNYQIREHKKIQAMQEWTRRKCVLHMLEHAFGIKYISSLRCLKILKYLKQFVK